MLVRVSSRASRAHEAESARLGEQLPANRQFFSQLLIRPIRFSKPSDVKLHDRMVSLVLRMLDLNKKLPAARTRHAKELIDRDIAATDERIDDLVYELYGLTAKEIRIVVNATANARPSALARAAPSW